MVAKNGVLRSHNHNTEAAIRALREEIMGLRGQLRSKNYDLVGLLDPQDPSVWDELVTSAIDAGLDRERLSKVLAVSPSTIHRWEAKQNVPLHFAREGIKRRIVEALAGTFMPLRERLRQERHG
jgi:hypothetical protein